MRKLRFLKTLIHTKPWVSQYLDAYLRGGLFEGPWGVRECLSNRPLYPPSLDPLLAQGMGVCSEAGVRLQVTC